VATRWEPITERIAGDVMILDVRSRGVTLGEGGGELIAKIRDVVSRGWVKILLNLLNVGYVDSGGLEEIVGSFKAVRAAGGAFALCCLGARIRDLLGVTKVDTHIPAYGSEEEALRGLQQRAD
jgi:anti-anti-sigma factor